MKQLTGQEKLDGFSIESYEGKYSGSFDIEEEVGRQLGYGDEIMTVTISRLKAPSFKDDANGDLKRVHTLQPVEVTIILDRSLRNAIYETLADMDSLALTLFTGRPTNVDDDGVLEPAITVSGAELDEEEEFRLEAVEPLEADDSTPVENVGRTPPQEEVWSPGAQRVVAKPPTGRDPVLSRFLEESVRSGR